MLQVIAKILITAVFTIIGSLTSSSTFAAEDAKPQIRTFKAGDVVFISELGAVIMPKGNVLVVDMVNPSDQRAKEYQKVDLRKDDEIIMINGKKAAAILDLSNAYNTVTIGQDVKLGVRRGTEMMIVSFPKADSKDLPGRRVMTFSTGDDSAAHDMTGMKMMKFDASGGDITLVDELGVILSEENSAVKVAGILSIDGQDSKSGSAKEGDKVTAVNDTKVTSLAEFNAAYDKIAVGKEFTVTVDQGGKAVSLKGTKSEKTGGRKVIKSSKNQ